MVSDLEDISSFDEKYVMKIDGIISRHNCQVEKRHLEVKKILVLDLLWCHCL